MSIFSYFYAAKKYNDPLKKAKLTGDGIEAKLKDDRSDTNIVNVMKEYFGISDLTVQEIAAIKGASPGNMRAVVGPMISKRANIGWTTGGHTGGEVVLFSYLPGDERITGLIQNTYVADYVAKALKIDMTDVNKKLFVKARPAFEAKGAQVALDTTDVNNPVLVVTKGNDILKFPVDKNIAILNGKSISMNGLTLYNGLAVYVPQEAVDLIK